MKGSAFPILANSGENKNGNSKAEDPDLAQANANAAGLERSGSADAEEDTIPCMEWDMLDQSFFWQSQKIGLLAEARDSQIISRPRQRRFMEEKNITRVCRKFL